MPYPSPRITGFMALCIAGGLLLVRSAPAMSPQVLFDRYWSPECVTQPGSTTDRYITFSADGWCEHFTDAAREHRRCDPVTWQALPGRRVSASAAGLGRYIIEMSAPGRLNLLLVTHEHPLHLEPIGTLGQAFAHHPIQTHLYCP